VIIEDRAINSSPSLYYTYIGSDFAAEGEKGAAAMCTLLNGMTGAYVLEIAGGCRQRRRHRPRQGLPQQHG